MLIYDGAALLRTIPMLPICLHLHLTVSLRLDPPPSPLPLPPLVSYFGTLAQQVGIDQVLWNPIFGVMFFSYMGFSNGDGPGAVYAKVKRDLMTQVIAYDHDY